jgi:hypothetical protein
MKLKRGMKVGLAVHGAGVVSYESDHEGSHEIPRKPKLAEPAPAPQTRKDSQ